MPGALSQHIAKGDPRDVAAYCAFMWYHSWKTEAAQTAPVVTFYRDGIEAAAKWIDKQREAYDSEHGWSDPDTGAFEFGNDTQRGYSSGRISRRDSRSASKCWQLPRRFQRDT
jgi:hypothetical protein